MALRTHAAVSRPFHRSSKAIVSARWVTSFAPAEHPRPISRLATNAVPFNFGTTSGHLRSGNFDGFRCKRHQQKHLVFFPTCFASRGPRVRVPPRPPTIFFFNEIASMFFQLTTCYSSRGSRFRIRLTSISLISVLSINCATFSIAPFWCKFGTVGTTEPSFGRESKEFRRLKKASAQLVLAGEKGIDILAQRRIA